MKKRIIIIVAILLVVAVVVFTFIFNKNITITFLDGKDVVETMTVEKGEVVSLPSLTKDGYDFVGWKYGDEIFKDNMIFKKNMTLNASWTAAKTKMTVSYYLGNGEEIITEEIDCNQPLKLMIPEKNGYRFVGWKDKDGKSVTNNSELTCDDIILKATWKEDISNLEEYSSLNFEEVLNDLGIEKKYTTYSPNDDAITIYLFYGSGCIHCHHFLEFMSSITDEYGKYFKMKAYEVWSNDNNRELLTNVLKQNSGVPYIIIGDKKFSGYNASYDERIKKAIMDLYQTSSNRYDIFDYIDN